MQGLVIPARCCIGLFLLLLPPWGAMASNDAVRGIVYLTGQHNIIPPGNVVTDITHVILAFMGSDVFNSEQTPVNFPLFTTVGSIRAKFEPKTKVCVAIGGWGDIGFEDAARNKTSRARWARNVRAMVDVTGADGVDIDWEYPGGNRDDYKQVPNAEREWEIESYVHLLEDLRLALGPGKLVSIAVPALERDLMAFTTSTMPRIIQQVDFLNVMTYDMMNRRDTVVKHHSGVAESRSAIQRYEDRGAPAHKLNLGLAYYVKWFMTAADCDSNTLLPLGCATKVLEDPDTGADLGRTSAFSWHDEVPSELAESFSRALIYGRYDEDGSYGFWDSNEARWWSFDTTITVEKKMANLVKPMGLGGVFAWGLGEDAPEFRHLKATMEGLKQLRRESARDEL